MKRLLLISMSVTLATAQLSAGYVAIDKKNELFSTPGMVAAIVAPAAILGVAYAIHTDTKALPRAWFIQNLNQNDKQFDVIGMGGVRDGRASSQKYLDTLSSFDVSRAAAIVARKSYGMAQGCMIGFALSTFYGGILESTAPADNKELQRQVSNIMLLSGLGMSLASLVTKLMDNTYTSSLEKSHYKLAIQLLANKLTHVNGHLIDREHGDSLSVDHPRTFINGRPTQVSVILQRLNNNAPIQQTFYIENFDRETRLITEFL